MRDALAASLLAGGALVILIMGPDHGVNGATILGLLLAVAGVALYGAADRPR